MSFYCNFSNGSNCSGVFQDVHVVLTEIQAIFALTIIAVTIPVNVLLILAMSIYRKMLDKSTTLLISSVVSNIIVTVLLNGEVFITSITRSWLLGYWGCQIFSFFLASGMTSSGLAAIHSYTDVCILKTFSQTIEQIFFYILLVLSWVLPAVFSAISTYICPAQFDATIPGCLSNPFAMILIGAMIAFWFTFLTASFWVLTCYKDVQHNIMTVYPSGIADQDTQRNKTCNILYKHKGILVTSAALGSGFIMLIILIGIRHAIGIQLLDTNVSSDIVISILYGLSLVVQLYVVTSILIMLSNKDIFNVTKKLLNQIFKQRRIQSTEQETGL